MKSLTHVVGDIFKMTDVQVIGHQANCQNTFGSGIAKTIKELYPEAYEADTSAYKLGTNKLGNFSVGDVKFDTRLNRHGTSLCRVYNLYGQNLGTDYTKRLNRKTDYEALYSALEGMSSSLLQTAMDKMMFDFCREPTIAFPWKMGSDRGGGSWDIVERLIEVAFDGYIGDILIVHYNK